MHFLKYKWIYFAISLIIVLPGLVSLILFGLKPSIDFTGGTVLEIQATASAQLTTSDLKNLVGAESVQEMGERNYLLRLHTTDASEAGLVKQRISEQYGPVLEKRLETVGPVIGRELTQKAVLAVVVASVLIVGYIAWSFRSIPKPYSSWKFGASAVFSLVHDVLVVLGIFSILGHVWGVEVDALFVTAMLTIIGFSVHDTIVVFDRVRENLPKMPQATFEDVVDFSLAETLVRSLNTSITVMLTLTALVIFGGESIRWFVVALLVGIVSGTYSSIFNAAPILAIWERHAHQSK